MGVVLAATHVVLGKSVALKMLSAQVHRSPDVLARFLREAQIAAQLPADHIAHVHDVGQTESGAPYLVMELLAGHDLDVELSKRGKLPLAEAVDYVLQAAEGVAEAHAVGLVHRDLKPANLFLTRKRDGTPVIKVLDFGLSKVKMPDGVTSLTATNSTFGTPQYMSPEQVRDSKYVDARCDQHALAMILYELCTGSTPYNGVNVTTLVTAIAVEPPPHVRALRPDVPEALDEAIVRALAKVPDERFPDLAAFAHAIAAAIGGAKAMASARNIHAILTAQEAPAPPDAPRPSGEPMASDEKVTLLRQPDRRRESTDALTSSARQVRRRGRRLTAILTAGGLVALLGGVVARAARPRPPPPPPPPTAAPPPPPPPDPAPTAAAAPPPAPAAAVAVPVATAEPASSGEPLVTPGGTAIAEPPASAAAKPGKAAPKGKPRPKPTDIDVFGGRR